MVWVNLFYQEAGSRAGALIDELGWFIDLLKASVAWGTASSPEPLFFITPQIFIS
jgi:hypothetical protein